MKTITVHTHVGNDGLLRLDLPTGLVDQDVEAVVIIQPAISQPATGVNTNGYPLNYFEAIDNIQADDLLERPAQGTSDVREPIE